MLPINSPARSDPTFVSAPVCTGLTVAGLTEEGFEVSLIPETLERTTLGGLPEGGQVNLEVDVIARYAERLVQGFGTEGRT